VNEQLITMAFSLLLSALNSSSSRNKFRRAFLKVFKSISEAYANDQAFQQMVRFMETPQKGH